MGETSETGWRVFFPLAFLWKSTPAELAGVLLVAVTIASNASRALTFFSVIRSFSSCSKMLVWMFCAAVSSVILRMPVTSIVSLPPTVTERLPATVMPWLPLTLTVWVFSAWT